MNFINSVLFPLSQESATMSELRHASKSSSHLDRTTGARTAAGKWIDAAEVVAIVDVDAPLAFRTSSELSCCVTHSVGTGRTVAAICVLIREVGTVLTITLTSGRGSTVLKT